MTTTCGRACGGTVEAVERLAHLADAAPAVCVAEGTVVLDDARAAGDLRTEMCASFHVGLAHHLLAQDTEALAAMERAQTLAHELDDRVCAARTLGGLGAVYAGFGDDEAAMELLEQSLAACREVGDEPGVAFALHQLGVRFQEMGLFPDRARELLHEACAGFERLGDQFGLSAGLSRLALLDVAESEALVDTDPELARSLAEAATQTAARAVEHACADGGSSRLLGESLVHQARALMAGDRLAEAQECITEATEHHEAARTTSLHLHLTVAKARLARLLGDWDTAIAELTRGIDATHALLRAQERVELLAELVTVHEDRGDAVAALAAHRELLTATLAHRDESAERRARALNAQRDLERAELTAEMERLKAEQLELANRVLAHEAAHDPLTGLANRRSFDQAIKARTAAPDARLTCLIGDLDHFKHVNDRYSHLVGDEVLRQVAQVVSAAVRGTDLVARFGGEEIAVLLADSDDPGTTARVCTRIRDSLAAHPWDDIAPGLRVTISIGAATRRPGEPADSVLARADHLMYQAKTTGRDRAVLDA
ncbi:diguanylate cyclase [Actinotalea sp. AC32]|nr:diguanylate cyclase [Actinotalea sp. AC32]